MKEQLEKIYEEATSDIENASSVKDLEDIKFKYLSRKGEFNEIKKGLKDLSVEDKKIVGSLANEITQKLESSIKDTLILDGGDFSMGTLIQTVYDTEAAELRMLGYLGCDVSTLGNHEFDYGSDGLADMLNAAVSSGEPSFDFNNK